MRAVLAALVLAAHSSLAAERHVAVLSVDGLGANELVAAGSCLARDSTIRALAGSGARAGVTGILPTVTYPTHASIVTGSDPATHGVIDNGARGVFWMKERSDIKADTLWDAAKRAGRTTAIVTWPSSYGANADFLVPEDLAPRTVAQEDIRKGSTPGLFDALSAAVGTPALLHFGHRESGTPLDRMTATFAAEIVRRHKPDLLLAHFLDYDHRMHAGPFSPDACKALERIDAWIAHILAAYTEAGIRERTTVFVVSDHGFLKVDKALNILGLLREADWGALSSDEKPEEAFDIKIAGGSVAFYPLQPRPEAWIAKVRAHLQPRIEAAHGERLRWITPAQAREFGGFPDAAFVLCARPGYSFRMLGSSAPELLVDPGRFVGAHGYCPDEPAMDALFVASGHGVRPAGDIGQLRMKDVGPTIATFLGAGLKDATGTDQSARFRAADAPGEARQRPLIAIENVSVVDVTRGEAVGPRTVLVAGGRITAIEAPDQAVVPAAAVRIDGRGRYLIPGLVDMHVHLFNNASRRPPNEWTFPLFVANGVTAVREMWTEAASMPIVERWRRAVARGDLVAPRVLAAGVAVRGPSEDSVRQQVRDVRGAGADFVKVFSEAPEPHWRAILDEARAQRLAVDGHVPAEVGAPAAAAGGQRSSEHLMQVYEACSPGEPRFLGARKGLGRGELIGMRDAQEREVLESFDGHTCARAAAKLARTGQAQVPTLVLSHFESPGAAARYESDPRWRYLRSDEQARWERILDGRGEEDEKLAALRLDVSRRIVKALHAARVPILAGTDAPMPLVYPGFSLHKELELLVESGLTAAEALRAATFGPAEFLGKGEDYGSIAVGKRADLVLLDANPLARIANTQRIQAVILDGRLLRRSDLDALLASSRSP